MLKRSAALLLAIPLVLTSIGSASAAPPADKGRPDSPGKAVVSTSVTVDVGARGNGQADGHVNGQANGHDKADRGVSAGSTSDKHGAASSGPLTSPQPPSRADANATGANAGSPCVGAYCSTRDGSASANGRGEGAAVGKPCAGCVGRADNKNPPGQAPNGSDANKGYECDENQGVGKTNPAHTGCRVTAAAPSPTPTRTPAVTPPTSPAPSPTRTTAVVTTSPLPPAPSPSPTRTTTVVTVTTTPAPAVTATATATATATTPPASPAATATATASPIGGVTGQPATSPTPEVTGGGGGGGAETPTSPQEESLGGGEAQPATAGEGSGLPFTGVAIAGLAGGALVLLLTGGALQLLARRREHGLTDEG